MKRTFIFVAVSLLITYCRESNAQKPDEVQIAGTNDKCAHFCSNTFEGKDASVKSCQQGCRLYSILQFVDKTRGHDGLLSGPNTTAIVSACRNECTDAYKSNSILQGACGQGCQHQTPFTTGHLKIVMDDSAPMFSFANRMMSEAFGKFDELQNSMKDRMDRMKNWFHGGDSPMARIENGDLANLLDRMDSHLRNIFNRVSSSSGIENQEDHHHRRLIGGKEDVAPSSASSSTVNPLYAYAQSLSRNRGGANKLDASSSSSSKSIDDDVSGEPILVVRIISTNGQFDGDERPRTVDGWPTFDHHGSKSRGGESSLADFENNYFGPAGGNGVDSDDTWLACFARRTQNLPMLTRWLLCVALMLSVLSMIYLCLAVMRANQQRRHRLFTQHKMNKSDGAYMIPPPMYEKVIPDEKSQSPPPAYEIAVGPSQADDPMIKNA